MPLIVAEMLIEMHGMNGRLDRMEHVLIQAVENIQQLSVTVKTAAEQVARQQEIYNRNFQLLQEADQRNTEMLATTLQNTIVAIGRRFDSLETRVEHLENK